MLLLVLFSVLTYFFPSLGCYEKKRNGMATSQLLTYTGKFDKTIVHVIENLRMQHNRANGKRMHKEITG